MAETVLQRVEHEFHPLDPAFYDDPYETYRLLRREAPVYWYGPEEFWVLSRYEDVKRVFRGADTFSVACGLTMGDSQRARALFPEGSIDTTGCPYPHAAEARRTLTASYNPEGAEMLLSLDPPRHMQVRRIINKAFTPRVVAGLEDWVRELAREALDTVGPGEVADFVDHVAVPVPMFVIAELLGIPREDFESFRRWSDAVIMLGNELDDEEQAYVAGQFAEFFEYIREVIEIRRSRPGDDLMTRLIGAEIDGEHLNQATLEALALQILAAGNETTRTLLSGAALALAAHPDQRELLVDDPGRIEVAVEEFLRWVTPIIHFARTAKERTELGGQTIEAGDYLILLIASANRDEEVWEDADVFDVRRSTDPMHLAFGFGEHLCLGASLARLEARVVFEELLRRFPRYEVAGPVVPVRSTLVNGIESMPMRFSAPTSGR